APEQVPGRVGGCQVRPFRERIPARPLGGLRGEAHDAGAGRAGARPADVQAGAAAAPGRLMAFAGRHVVLGVSGGIACYKSCTLARRLTEAGATVDVVLTVSAAAGVRALTSEALTCLPALPHLW